MKIDVHQIYYRDELKEYLDPAFIPYDNSKGNSKWFEYGVFRREYLAGTPQKADYTGFVSWKFNKKTGITGEEFLSFLRRYPGYDVYFINPYEADALCFQNVWYQGEYYHPGSLAFTQKILNKIGYDISLESLVMPWSVTAFCNYWVASPKFWERYMRFTEPVYDYIENKLTPEESAFIQQPADAKIQADYIPFIMERLFSTYLYLNPDNITFLKYSSPKYYLQSPRSFATGLLRIFRKPESFVFRGKAPVTGALYKAIVPNR